MNIWVWLIVHYLHGTRISEQSDPSARNNKPKRIRRDPNGRWVGVGVVHTRTAAQEAKKDEREIRKTMITNNR